MSVGAGVDQWIEPTVGIFAQEVKVILGVRAGRVDNLLNARD